MKSFFSPYVVAAIVAGLIVAVVNYVGLSLGAAAVKVITQARNDAAVGGEPDGEDSSGGETSEDMSDFGMELDSNTRLKLQVADLIVGFRWLWIPLVIGVCFGVTVLMRKAKRKSG